RRAAEKRIQASSRSIDGERAALHVGDGVCQLDLRTQHVRLGYAADCVALLGRLREALRQHALALVHRQALVGLPEAPVGPLYRFLDVEDDGVGTEPGCPRVVRCGLAGEPTLAREREALRDPEDVVVRMR